MSEEHNYAGISPTCIIHGNMLAEIKVMISELDKKVGIQNGRVLKAETNIAELTNWRSEVKGGRETTAKLIRDWVMILGLGLALWQNYNTDRKMGQPMQVISPAPVVK